VSVRSTDRRAARLPRLTLLADDNFEQAVTEVFVRVPRTVTADTLPRPVFE
jgi:hypothetical protein